MGNWVATRRRRLDWQFRRFTWRARALPDFLVIGAQKSGTSSLHSCLGQHPAIRPALKKEVHYFDGGVRPGADTFRRPLAWYRAHFPWQAGSSRAWRTFEASPLYLFHPLAPERIASLLPGIKLVAILRNPTDRAISHYLHTRRDGEEPLSLREALDREDTRLGPVLAGRDYKARSFIVHSYKARGLYRDQLERYLRYFDRSQLLVLGSEEFFRAPDAVLQRIFGFVGVDPSVRVDDLEPRNVGDSVSEAGPDVIKELDAFFRPHNQALYELIGQDLGW